MRTRSKISVLNASLAALATVVLLAGCTAAPAGDSTQSGSNGNADAAEQTAAQDTAATLAAYNLDGLDSRQLIDKLDTTPLAERPQDLMASIQPGELKLADGAGNEASLALPGDEFYVSVAPYISQTHDCTFHSLTTCVGELQNIDIEVLVTDDADGSVLVEESTQTFDNGFIGLWLPRDLNTTLTITHDGKSVTTPISTADDAPTCVTTAKLS